MNLLEHYIKEVHSIEDATHYFEELLGFEPSELIYKIDLTYDCYGHIERDVKFFYKSEWDIVKKDGYFMA